MGIDVIIEQLDELIPLGLSSVLLFPVLDGADNLKVKSYGTILSEKSYQTCSLNYKSYSLRILRNDIVHSYHFSRV